MGRLYFSARARARARKRQRRRRTTTALAVVSMAAVAAGIPGSDAGLVLIRDLADSGALRADATTVQASESAASMLRFRRELFDARPKPTPSPSAETEPDGAESDEAAPATDAVAAAPAGSIAEIVYAAAAEFGIDGGYLLAVAECESTLNPWAENAAGYYGLFQFDEQTWAAYGYGSIYDPVAQSRTAARLLAAGQYSRWPNCA